MPSGALLIAALGVPSGALLVAALDIGRVFPVNLDSPSSRLLYAARVGDVLTVRKFCKYHKIENLDIDSALDAAAAYAHMPIVKELIAFGATDLESALLSAAARDHVKVVAYLISEERPHPATNIEDAQVLASNMGATNCDWLLTAHRWGELRS